CGRPRSYLSPSLLPHFPCSYVTTVRSLPGIPSSPGAADGALDWGCTSVALVVVQYCLISRAGVVCYWLTRVCCAAPGATIRRPCRGSGLSAQLLRPGGLLTIAGMSSFVSHPLLPLALGPLSTRTPNEAAHCCC